MILKVGNIGRGKFYFRFVIDWFEGIDGECEGNVIIIRVYLLFIF